METCILFRKFSENAEEVPIIEKHFPIYFNRSSIRSKSIVIPRYSCLPYYNELEKDVENTGSKLVNSYKQFRYISEFRYYMDIEEYTFRTYFSPMELPYGKSFVVKGVTNSKKQQWDRLCFAVDRDAAIKIYCELKNDGLIGSQDIIFREYEELIIYERLANGLPVTNEYRIFFYYGEMVGHGYYWSIAENINKSLIEKENSGGLEFAEKINKIIAPNNNFYSMDIAQRKDGTWVLVELNSGEMSGLSCCDCDTIYSNMKFIGAKYE